MKIEEISNWHKQYRIAVCNCDSLYCELGFHGLWSFPPSGYKAQYRYSWWPFWKNINKCLNLMDAIETCKTHHGRDTVKIPEEEK